MTASSAVYSAVQCSVYNVTVQLSALCTARHCHFLTALWESSPLLHFDLATSTPALPLPTLPICTVLYCKLHHLYLCALCLVCCQHKTTFTQNLHSYKLSFHSVFYKFELRQELNGMEIFQENLTTTSTTINDNQGACQKV